jgi:hypothetical protein
MGSAKAEPVATANTPIVMASAKATPVLFRIGTRIDCLLDMT